MLFPETRLKLKDGKLNNKIIEKKQRSGSNKEKNKLRK